MRSKTSYTLVGLFVILLGGGLVTTVVWLIGSSTDKAYDTYVAYMRESVWGLSPNSTVSYRGVNVGRVIDISLDGDNPERVRLLMNIERGTPIREDTVAILSTQGLTGIAHVELTGGSRDSPPLGAEPGQRYREIQTGPSLFVRVDTAVTILTDELSESAARLSEVARRLESTLDEDNRRALAATLANVETVTSVLVERRDEIGKSVASLSSTLRNTATASRDVPKLVSEARTMVSTADRALGSFDAVAARADETLARLDEVATELNTLVKGTRTDMQLFTRNTPADVDGLITELRALSQALQRVTRELEQDPAMLVFGRSGARPGPGE